MAQLVFNKENLRQLKEGLDALLDIFSEVLETRVEHGVIFSHDDIIEKLETIEQDKWRSIYNILLHDPFLGYCNGNFSPEEMVSPAKIVLDFVKVMDQVGTDVAHILEHYQKTVKTLATEKSDLEASLSKAESRMRQERSLTSQEKMELKHARSSLIFWEGLVKSKSDKIAELQRQQNIQLWEREKDRIFAQSDKKIKDLEKELDDQKNIIENLTRRLAQMEENNKMLRMRRDLTKGALLSDDSGKSNEQLKRSIYLLEKDVIFLEQQLYTQQRTFATVLCGLKTDLLVISDQLADQSVPKPKWKEFVQLCQATSGVFKAMLDGDLTETLKKLPPHYSYLPNVHFASDPHFLTVHIVGTEDRNGGWHHVIRERHNFERRVAALEQRLSPFLEARYRNKVLTQREGSRTIMNHT